MIPKGKTAWDVLESRWKAEAERGREGRMMLRCDNCGHWIAYDDLANQSARRALVTPDAEGTREEWETLCPLCKRAQEVGGI